MNGIDMEDNEKLREMIDNSREVIRENWYESSDKLSEEEEKILHREMRRFNEYGDAIYIDEDYAVLSKKINKLAEFAERYLNSNVDEAFDRVTINRNMKEAKQYIRKFNKIAQEMKEKSERLQALYEDIGVIFNRYFEVKDRDNVSFDE